MWIGGRGRRRRRHRIPDPFSNQRRNEMNNGINEMNNGTNDHIFNDLGTSKIVRNNRISSRLKYWTIIASSALFALITPAVNSAMLPVRRTSISAEIARNIRHLPCVSRRTGETGLCMFAYSCAKANGTHLGTCIDRFYFGSCCKIPSSTDVDLAEPIVHNYLSNKEDGSISSSTFKTPYQKPSVNPLPDYSDNGSSSTTITIPVSMSTYLRPSSAVVSIPSSSSSVGGGGSDFYSSTFVKTSSTAKPSSAHASSVTSYDTVPSVTSQTPPIVNLPFSQSYSTPATHVTASPISYSTSVVATFQSAASHKPISPYATTAYSKPLTKPTSKPSSKPSKPKPPSQSKPVAIKPKPKPSLKPSSETIYTSFYTQATSPVSLVNKTTLHTYTNGLSSTTSFSTESSSVPTKLYGRPSSNQGIPTPVSQFTSSKKPIKPITKPFLQTATAASTTAGNYVEVPVSLMQNNSPPSTASTLSTYIQSVNSMPNSMTYNLTTGSVFSSTETILKMNTSVSENKITEKPITRPWMTSPDKPFSTRPWFSQSTTSASTTSQQPSLVTWTTIEEVPAIILPDRTKPTSIVKPSWKPPVTRPTFMPNVSKPSPGKPAKPVKPVTKPDLETEENYRPTITMALPSSSHASTTGSSTAWVEVSVTTHAPTVPQTNVSSGTSTGFTHSSSKPSTAFTIPVASPLPAETTTSAFDSNDIPESPPLNMSNYREVCGRRIYPSARIVGGEKATFGKWPWQISLRQWRTSTYLHKCGAALFNENWAVTAAHCVENVPPSDLLLRLGEHDLSIEEEPFGYQERRVQIVASHPQFDPRTFEYDLALLRFYEPVKFQPNIIPVCVPEDDINFVGSSAFVTGWGRLYEDGPLPSVLQEVSVPVINNSVCESMYQAAGYIEHIPNIFICAGWRKGGFDSCEGDSGGPMVIQRPDKRWLLAGVISWGIGCAEPNQPGVYTRISEFRDWVNQILQF